MANPVHERSTLVINGVLLTDGREKPFPGWISWSGGIVVGLGPGSPSQQLLDDASQIVDAAGCVVTPGFINAHTHLFQTMLRGIRTDLCLEDWLDLTIWPYIGRFSPEDFQLAATLGAIENLKSGATTVFENHYVHTSPKNSHSVAAGLAESGIRATIFHGGTNRGEALATIVGDKAVDSIVTSTPQYLSQVDDLANAWHGFDEGRISIGVAAQTAWLCTPDFVEDLATYADENNLNAHAHCAETARSVAGCVEETGLREIDMFNRAGFLRPGTSLAHCVYLESEEIQTLATTGAVVSHCPVSNAYLGSGVAPIPEMLAAGVPVALATDGPASNNRQDSFESLKWAVNIQKAHHADAAALLDTAALDMAWAGGAQGLQQSGLLGTLRVGAAADVVITQLDSAFVTPVHDVISTIVFGSAPTDVRDVFVAGKQVVRNGRSTQVDETALKQQASTRALELGLQSLRVHS